MNEPCAEQWLTKHLIGEGYFITVANPDLHISGGGGGGGHPHPGKQHTNLWASCGFLGVLSLFRRYNLDLCLSG